MTEPHVSKNLPIETQKEERLNLKPPESRNSEPKWEDPSSAEEGQWKPLSRAWLASILAGKPDV